MVYATWYDSKGGSDKNAVSRDLSKRRPEFDIREVQLVFVVVKMALGQVFFRYSDFPCQYNSTGVPYLPSPTCRWQKDKRTKTKDPHKRNLEALDRKVNSHF
jgi:hypothetical protein